MTPQATRIVAHAFPPHQSSGIFVFTGDDTMEWLITIFLLIAVPAFASWYAKQKPE